MGKRGERGQIRVRVTSDNICPWCRKGKAQLEEAMASEQYAGIDFEVEVSRCESMILALGSCLALFPLEAVRSMVAASSQKALGAPR